MNSDAIIYCLVQGIGAALIMWLCLCFGSCASTKNMEKIPTTAHTS